MSFTPKDNLHLFPLHTRVEENRILSNFNVFQARVDELNTTQMHARLGTGSDVRIQREPSKRIECIEDGTHAAAVATTAATAGVVSVDMTAFMATMGNTTTIPTAVVLQEHDPCYPCVRQSRYLAFLSAHGRQHSAAQSSLAVLMFVLYVFWIFLNLVSETDAETMVTASFAWVWTPVLFIQLCHLVEARGYVYVAVVSFGLLTLQQYWALVLSSTREYNFMVDMFLLLQQTVTHVALQGGLGFPVWSFVATSLFCAVLRVVTFDNVDVFVMVSILNNTYLFVLAILSVIMYPTVCTAKETKERKQP
jgi:hypothetical protein